MKKEGGEQKRLSIKFGYRNQDTDLFETNIQLIRPIAVNKFQISKLDAEEIMKFCSQKWQTNG